ncbi:MAG: malonate-semialdehyde dehydrogenase (acetylating) / methylmalonate-semialdehyde dehydrogenase [Gemmatimonadales bacterium]|jgi:malonate-semialdehyde dehydrogenase (acetylating)/methylmalonate-semialdehyde dehydrogenase|nr:malonate-semialdehyde dehydrogenase (acetylating) / methylmalonate-semialdehyde dehydrogenase [Gemmatimonadales bacterium]
MITSTSTAAPRQTPTYPSVRNLIGGRFVSGEARSLDVLNPSDGSVLSSVPLSSAADVDAAVRAAAAAFPAWSTTPIKERVQVFFRYRALLEQHRDELSALIGEEHGKIRSEAEAEVSKAIELTEFACSLPQIVTGEVLEVSRGVECRTDRHPIGVVASIVPFNFPSMVPHWTIPNAIALGNCMILKPSELVPLSAGRIGELLTEAGLPAGVFNVVHGAQEVVEALCDHPGIAAITFVGSTRVAKIVYRRGTANLKRVLALGGAKNHLFVLPDANPDMSSSNIVASMSGCAGQRCMAASVMLAVAGTDHIVRRLVEHARAVIPGENLGPVISLEAKERIERYIGEAEAAGATVLLDGRQAAVPGSEGGFWVGPTILDHVRPEMKIAQEEVFGPVLVIVRVGDVDQALAIENASPYGNAAAVFTESGGLARYITDRASAGMVGVNVGVPVPREPFSFGGWNESKFGVGDITGRGSIEFWTRAKKTTTKWNREAGTNWMA